MADVKRFRLVNPPHQDEKTGEIITERGKVIESEKPLDTMFANKFKALGGPVTGKKARSEQEAFDEDEDGVSKLIRAKAKPDRGRVPPVVEAGEEDAEPEETEEETVAPAEEEGVEEGETEETPEEVEGEHEESEEGEGAEAGDEVRAKPRRKKSKKAKKPR